MRGSRALASRRDSDGQWLGGTVEVPGKFGGGRRLENALLDGATLGSRRLEYRRCIVSKMDYHLLIVRHRRMHLVKIQSCTR